MRSRDTGYLSLVTCYSSLQAELRATFNGARPTNIIMTRQISKTIPKIGAVDLARGCRLFSEDIPLDGALTLQLFRSKKAHARILSLDVEKARKVNGVVGILTAKDIPGKNLFGLINKDQPLLAHEKVRFVGEAIALVAAADKEAAQKALEAIEVTYEDLPTLIDPEDSLKEGAPLIHAKGNLLSRRVIRKGNAAEALSGCDVVIKKTYRTPHVEHSYLEPDAGAGFIDQDGTLVIYASTQNPHYDLKEVSEILGLEEERIRIIQAATGGGFGSKLDLTVQGYIGLALYHFRRPVRLAFSREEAFLATPKRHPMKIEFETGASKDGKIQALRARIICDTGAYASYGRGSDYARRCSRDRAVCNRKRGSGKPLRLHQQPHCRSHERVRRSPGCLCP